MSIFFKRILYLSIYLLTITPYFFLGWFRLFWLDILSDMSYSPKLYFSLILYITLLLSISFILFFDVWERDKSCIVIIATISICFFNIILPSLLFFDGINITIFQFKISFILVVLNCIYYFLGKKLIEK